ncbi:hypothetical protein [Streptomyces sp. NPDC088789]|uniref:hypothetical protein n=1 Tax=Streptomyces sp. NPDC088789 TaxID=3365899 RepID=UPI0038304BBA
MDMQEIALIITTSVAVVGVPCTLLIGRWQLRAALHAAGAAYGTGLRQAEVTYQAALDTVRAQSESAHDQWLRGVRREACSIFLLAAEEAVEAVDQVLEGKGAADRWRPVRRDLQRALVVLELEGDAELVGSAMDMVASCDEMAEAALSNSSAARAWRSLVTAFMEEQDAATRQDRSVTPITDAVNALSDLRFHLTRVRDAYTSVEAPDDVSAGTISALAHYLPAHPEQFASTPDEAHDVLRHAYEAVMHSLELTTLPDDEVALLLDDAVNDGRSTMLDYITGQSTRLDEARRTFLATARRVLDSTDGGTLPLRHDGQAQQGDPIRP